MGERCERMGPNEGSSGEPFAVKCRDRFNLEARGQNLGQVKDTTEKAGFLLIVFMRAVSCFSSCRPNSREPSWRRWTIAFTFPSSSSRAAARSSFTSRASITARRNGRASGGQRRPRIDGVRAAAAATLRRSVGLRCESVRIDAAISKRWRVPGAEDRWEEPRSRCRLRGITECDRQVRPRGARMRRTYTSAMRACG